MGYPFTSCVFITFILNENSTLIFIFKFHLWCLNKFYKDLLSPFGLNTEMYRVSLCIQSECGKKAVIKLFEAPQRNVKIKIEFIFFSSFGIGIEKVKVVKVFFPKRFTKLNCLEEDFFIVGISKFSSNSIFWSHFLNLHLN